MACPAFTSGRRPGFSSAIPARRTGVRRHPRPWAAKIARPPYADRDRCRGSGTRPQDRPDRACRRPAVPAVRRRRAHACGRYSARSSASPSAAGTNLRSTASSTAFSIGSSVTTQVWPTRALTWPLTVDAGALTRQVEDGREARQVAHTGEVGDLRAHRCRRFDFHMQTGLRDIVHGHRHAPEAFGFLHRIQTLKRPAQE